MAVVLSISTDHQERPSNQRDSELNYPFKEYFDGAAQFQYFTPHPAQNTIVNYRMGLIDYNNKRYAMAYKYFEKVVNLYPFGYDVLLMFAWTILQLGKSREAKILFGNVLLMSPEDASAKEGLTLIK